MSERGLERRHGREVFLRLAAYRASHQGRLPPVNSDLWREYARLKSGPRDGDPDESERHAWFPFRWPWRRDAEKSRIRPRPLAAFKVEKPFLTDDYTPEKVEARLQGWPMIGAFGMVERHPMGEWFIYCIEVMAEDLGQAMRIVECIFMVPYPA